MRHVVAVFVAAMILAGCIHPPPLGDQADLDAFVPTASRAFREAVAIVDPNHIPDLRVFGSTGCHETGLVSLYGHAFFHDFDAADAHAFFDEVWAFWEQTPGAVLVLDRPGEPIPGLTSQLWWVDGGSANRRGYTLYASVWVKETGTTLRIEVGSGCYRPVSL